MSLPELRKNESWYLLLDHSMQDLVEQCFKLAHTEAEYSKDRFHDYSFLVFPIAKAYEGFIKKYIFSLGLINEEDLLDPHFRIGRSLSPDLPKKYRDKAWVYQDLALLGKECGVDDLAPELWRLWREGRNKLFHYFFPDHVRFIDRSEAEDIILDFVKVMDQAVACVDFDKEEK